MSQFLTLDQAIHDAQQRLATLLKYFLESTTVTPAIYARYLSMQYHLTKGVQRYFITAAAHETLARRKKLRQFLLDFANEEELHYVVAANDLHKARLPLSSMPFDVELWHSYFREVVITRPFVRIGAACILENISGGAAKTFVQMALSQPFLNRDNTKFLVLHQHETLPHGDEIIAALEAAKLDSDNIADLVEGARKGTIMYIRFAEWALFPDSLSALADSLPSRLTVEEEARIKTFSMTELEVEESK